MSNKVKTFLDAGTFAGERVGIITLGCARNVVDSEKILSDAKSRGAKVTSVSGASTVLVNTCAFTKEAKEESLDVIFDLIDLKKKGKLKKIVICGCLSERYGRELRENFKEVDDFFGIADFKKTFDAGSRLTAPHLAYLKISEGCANQCSYCAIPQIKGSLRSRDMNSLLQEARSLEELGVRELNIVGQDITLFGLDKPFSRSRKEMPLVKLLGRILKETSIPWIRLLYLHPKRLSGDLIELMAGEKRICPYVDLPLQHINNRILKLMNRGVSKEEIGTLIEKLRAGIPGVALRTTFIVGFPSESVKEFQELLGFVRKIQFDRLGAFKYSREEGTKAYSLKGQVSEKVKQRRYDVLMSLQKEISGELQKNLLGQVVEVLIEEDKTEKEGVYVGRTRQDAPEVDGVVFLKSGRTLDCGSIVNCRITDAYEYDLVGEILT